MRTSLDAVTEDRRGPLCLSLVVIPSLCRIISGNLSLSVLDFLMSRREPRLNARTGHRHCASSYNRLPVSAGDSRGATVAAGACNRELTPTGHRRKDLGTAGVSNTRIGRSRHAAASQRRAREMIGIVGKADAGQIGSLLGLLPHRFMPMEPSRMSRV